MKEYRSAEGKKAIDRVSSLNESIPEIARVFIDL
jgi:hypothetical protein